MTEEKEQAPLWGGRFRKELHPAAKKFSSSIGADKRFVEEDITGSIAHVTMLGECGIVTSDESAVIVDALKMIKDEFNNGTLEFSEEGEDIHLAIEELLTERIGALGGKLHTARSRNDQIALDQRLFLRKAIQNLKSFVENLQFTLVVKADENIDVIIPGYTHMQRAQPVLLSHHLLAYVAMLGRDTERLEDCYKRVDRSPLGAAAFAGTSFPIDRMSVAKQLDFQDILINSVDAVSDRDYLIELAGVCSIVMMHLSRMAEELILWSTVEFGFVEMDDSVSTGSSIMPQKKNPDIAELVRGKTGSVYGSLMNLLTIMKGLPLAYDRDMQCDKEPMFEMIDTASDCLGMMKLVIENTSFRKERLKQTLSEGYLTATEVADYLVRKGETFREAHRITGELVGNCAGRGIALSTLGLYELQSFSPRFETDVYEILDPERSIKMKLSYGSTSHESVAAQLTHWRNKLRK
jgi:argininosuccinate lyase